MNVKTSWFVCYEDRRWKWRRGRDTEHAGPVEAGAGVESRGEAAIVEAIVGTLQLSIQCEHNSRAANSRPCNQGLLAHISQTLKII